MENLQTIVELGEEIGLAGEDLKEFVKEQQDRAREERRLDRERRKGEDGREQERRKEEDEREQERQNKQEEREDRAAKARHAREMELALTQLKLEELRLSASAETRADKSVSTRVTPYLTVPKFDEKQLDDVGKYLDMFESIMRKNGTESER